MKLKNRCHIQLCVNMDCGLYHSRLLCPWGFYRQESWRGSPCPPPRSLPNPGIKPRSPTLRADSLPVEPPGSPRILAWVAYPFLGDLLNPGIEPGSPELQADSLPAELPGKHALSFSKIPFIKLRKCPSIPNLLGFCCCHENMLNFFRFFLCVYWDVYVFWLDGIKFF